MQNTIKTRKNCFRYIRLMSPLNAAICTTISYTLWVEWYYLKNNYLTLRSKVKVPWRSLRYATHRLMVMHPHTNYHLPISKDKNVMARTRKYYLKNNYLTFRSTVKVQQRSLRHATHHLMIMHPHTKYHWPISKDKKVMVRTSFAEKKRKRKKKIRLKQYVSLRTKGRHNNTWVQENVDKH
jgi:acyl-CoA thioesterase FadM